jgi:hypothetical protein
MQVTKINKDSKMVEITVGKVEEESKKKEIRFTLSVKGDFTVASELVRTLVNQLDGQFALSEEVKK